VRYNTRPCIRRLIRFGSGKAGIAAMAQAISQQRSGCSAGARTMPCGNEHTDIEFERSINKISLTHMRKAGRKKNAEIDEVDSRRQIIKI